MSPSEAKSGSADGPPVRDDLPMISDAPAARPGLGFDRLAASAVGVVDAATASARQAGEPGSVAIGLYGPPGSGRSTLLQAIWNALPAERYTRVAIDPARIAAGEGVYGHLRDRAMERLTARFLGIRSRNAVKALLWISDHPWLYGLALLLVLTALALLVDPSLSWQMVDDVYHAWKTAKTGEEVRAVRYIMEWYPVGVLLHAAPWIAAGLPLLVRLAPPLLKLVSMRFATVSAKDAASNPQALCQDLAAMAASTRRTLAFFVDDVDRCDPPRVADLIDAIHRLSDAGCAVFAACDDRYVEAALGLARRENLAPYPGGDGHGRALLAEAVQVPIRIPALDRAGVRAILLAAPAHPGGSEGASLGAIVEDIVGPFIGPLGLDIRFLKTLVRAIKLQLGLDGIEGEAAVRRLVAIVFAGMADPDWLDAYAGGREPQAGSALARHGDIAERLRRMIGGDAAALDLIRRQLGYRSRPPAPAAGALTVLSDRR